MLPTQAYQRFVTQTDDWRHWLYTRLQKGRLTLEEYWHECWAYETHTVPLLRAKLCGNARHLSPYETESACAESEAL